MNEVDALIGMPDVCYYVVVNGTTLVRSINPGDIDAAENLFATVRRVWPEVNEVRIEWIDYSRLGRTKSGGTLRKWTKGDANG